MIITGVKLNPRMGRVWFKGTPTGPLDPVEEKPVVSSSEATVPFSSTDNLAPLIITGNVESLTITVPPQHGAAMVFGLTILYTPTVGYYGPDSFTFTATNKGGTSDPATVAFIVQQGIPVAHDISNTVAFNGLSTFAANVSGPFDTIEISGDPANGWATAVGTNIRYTPNFGFDGPDSFAYTASNETGTSDPATVSMTVLPQIPVAKPGSMTVAYNSAVNPVPLDLTGGGVATNVKTKTAPHHGSVTANGVTMNYKPTLGYSGSDSFTYTANNAGGASPPATISITVTPQAPVANPTNAVVEYNSSNNVIVPNTSGGAVDILEVASDPIYGTVTVSGVTFLYTPPNDYQGADSFTYHAKNNGGGSDNATISITVNAPPPPPRPRWLTASNLGTFDKNVEFFIPLEHTDPLANITGFELVAGALPFGVLLNPYDGSISGTPTDTTTTVYTFSVAIKTGDNLEPVVGEFSLTINAELTRVVWQTDSDLGSVDGGSGFSAALQATSVKNNGH